MVEGKEGTLDMLIKKDGVKRKEERKLNEAEKAEEKLERELPSARKREGKKKKLEREY